MDAKIRSAEPIRVLFVEDEFLIGEWIAQSLLEQGFAVEKVSNAAHALDHIASAAVDILLTDINLPGGMDGTALARRAAELARRHRPAGAALRVRRESRAPRTGDGILRGDPTEGRRSRFETQSP